MAAGLVGVLAVAMTQITENLSNSQRFANFGAEKNDLGNITRMVLGTEKHCRVSLAGDGDIGEPLNPVRFKKEDIDNIEKKDEGLPVSLWLADQSGNRRASKRLNGLDDSDLETEEKSRYGSIDLKSIRLYMPNPVSASNNQKNYEESFLHTDVGEIRMVIERKVNAKQKRDSILSYPVQVSMKTNSSGDTTILSCSSIVAPDSFLQTRLSPNGHVQFPNGLIMQWGRFRVSPNGRTTIYFTKAFEREAFSITVSGTRDFSINSKDNAPTLFDHPRATNKISFQVQSSSNSSEPISWMAIGM